MAGKKGRSGRRKLLTDEQLRELDASWKVGIPISSTARRIGLKPKTAHNAHYKLRMRRVLYGTDIGDARTNEW